MKLLGYSTTLIAVFACSMMLKAQQVFLQSGMNITASCQVAFGEYVLDAGSDLEVPLMTIEGEDIVVDFQQSVLRSSMAPTQPDRFAGVAVLIRNSRNVTLRNARIHGYKIAVRAINCEQLTIEYCDFSYNYRQQLNSTRWREDVSDWLSFHHNEHDEWLRYGAAIYLRNCRKSVISNNRVTGGQCALMMTRCDSNRIVKNDFTFNSAIGIGLYRSSHNRILNNRLSFNIRGYSHGRYHRGQDSAAILVYEQSSHNIIAGNEATHSGDGLFLWAGQFTMDTGTGGSNNNVIYANDFSDASNNGVEATFSSNVIAGNRIHRCHYGVWAGYSYQTPIVANDFARNETAIAIEHGQDNEIAGNSFVGDHTALKLWSRSHQPADWGFVRHRNTESRGYRITNNIFRDVTRIAEVHSTGEVVFRDNIREGAANASGPADDATAWVSDTGFWSIRRSELLRLYRPDTAVQLPPVSAWAGRQHIRMTEWGPYDYRRPLIWLDSIAGDGKYHLLLLGPDGKWRLRRAQGLAIVRFGGTLPDTLQARPMPGYSGHYLLQCAYLGSEIIDEFGRRFVPDILKPYYFSFQEERYAITWQRSFYDVDAFKKKKSPAAAEMLWKRAPLLTDTVQQIDFTWWQSPDKRLPADNFALRAVGRAEFPAGEYEIALTADDAVRLFVDDQLVLDAWQPPASAYADDFHHRILVYLNGMHQFRIEYLELSGLAALSFRIRSKNSQP